MRNTSTSLVLCVSLGALFVACKKNEPEAAPTPPTPPAAAEPAKPAEPPPPAEPAKPAEPVVPGETAKPAGDEVRAPTADDLAEYTKDIKGKGPLKAVFETT